VHTAVETAFLDGLRIGSLVAAGIAAVAAAVVAVLLPARQAPTNDVNVAVPEGLAAGRAGQ
jgi:hypothetical protein